MYHLNRHLNLTGNTEADLIPDHQTITLLYILFIWLVVLHTLEEIAQEIFTTRIGRIQMTKRKYLLGASLITTLNLGTLSLIIIGNTYGLYFGIFTSTFIGIFQAPIHAFGFYREGYKSQKLGAGFYSSIPLAIVGLVLLIQILKVI